MNMRKVYTKPLCYWLMAEGNQLLAGSGGQDVDYVFGEKDKHEGNVDEDDGKRDSEAKHFNAWESWDM